MVLSSVVDGSVRLWDVASGREAAVLEDRSGWVRSVCFSPDGKLLASGGDGSVRLWDVVSGREAAVLEDRSGGVRSVCFSPDGKLLASGGWAKAILTEIVGKRGKAVKLIERMSTYNLPDGEWAALDGSNRFVCSAGGREYVAFRDNLAVYTASDLPELEHPEGLFLAKRKNPQSVSV
jgi:WD40 repeat protein